MPRPLGGDLVGERLIHHPGALGWGLQCQLLERKFPLHEEKHPLPVKVRDDGGRRQPFARQVTQRVGVHLELGLAIGG